MEKIPLKQRDLILVPFPFSDQTGRKIRPALIISNDQFNQNSDDVLVCAITSSFKQSKYNIFIDSTSIETGILYDKSAIKTETITKIQKSIIIKKIATLQKTIFTKTISTILEIIKPT